MYGIYVYWLMHKLLRNNRYDDDANEIKITNELGVVYYMEIDNITLVCKYTYAPSYACSWIGWGQVWICRNKKARLSNNIGDYTVLHKNKGFGTIKAEIKKLKLSAKQIKGRDKHNGSPKSD